MRVTQNMLNQNMLTSLNRNLGKMETLQRQMTTGKKINKPSDDPVGLSSAMRYRSELEANEQYQRNLDDAQSWVEFNDTTVGQAVDVLHRARELAVQGANDSNPQEAKNAVASEVEELFDQLMDIANSQFNGKYVFNGQKTDQPPYPTDDAYQDTTFDDGKINFEVSRSLVLNVNVHAGQVFGEAEDEDNAFATLNALSTALRDGDKDGVDQALGHLDSRLDQVLESWSDIGARSNRLELIDNRLKDSDTNMQTLLSKTEDADMAAVITNLRTAENVYQASLATGARIISPTLMDFLR
nr:flagellar hook-associated protein FlgL [Caldalkalibacillus salinus]